MFEIGLISIVVLAVGYWVTLWLMRRHDDVLHGDFVHEEDAPATSAAPDHSSPSPFPTRPVFPAKRALTGPRPVNTVSVPTPFPQASPPALSDRSDTLQTLLASIKQDLKDASQL